MTSGSNLKIRNSVYYARQVVPVDLAQHFPSRELVKSLNTKDRRTANVRKLAVLSAWHMRFEELRRKRNMSEADFANATWAHYSAELLQDGTDRLTNGNISPVASAPNQSIA
jgi:hypothetical protein